MTESSSSLVFWKPYGVLCQFTPGIHHHHSTLKDWVDLPNVYPAGRLDRESEGLLVLTSNGALQHLICHPKFDHQKTYWVQVERTPTEEALSQLRQGIRIKSGLTQPAQVRRIEPPSTLPPRDPPIRFRKSIETAWLEITISEGKNRQVRRMTAAVGHPTLRLIRVGLDLGTIGGAFSLNGLKPGEWRFFTSSEIRKTSELVKVSHIRLSTKKQSLRKRQRSSFRKSEFQQRDNAVQNYKKLKKRNQNQGRPPKKN